MLFFMIDIIFFWVLGNTNLMGKTQGWLAIFIQLLPRLYWFWKIGELRRAAQSYMQQDLMPLRYE
jgi:hypothetical protein